MDLNEKEVVFEPGGWNETIYRTCNRLMRGFWFEAGDAKEVTNLCQWVRTVFLWPLLFGGFFLGSAYMLVSTIIEIRAQMQDAVIASGFWAYIISAFIAVFVIAGIIGLIVLLVNLPEIMAKRRKRRSSGARSDALLLEGEKETSMFAALWIYLVAQKQKICPTIRYAHKPEVEGP